MSGRMVHAASLAVRFLLELVALATLWYWGATTSGAAPMRWVLAAAAPTAAAVLWGTLVAPKAPVTLPRLARHTIALTLFALVAVALHARGHVVPAVTFLGIAVLNAAVLAWVGG